MRRARGSAIGGLTGVIILIGLVLALTIYPFNLPIFFVAIAIAIFVGSLSTLNPQRIYGALFGSMWMLILALYFVTHAWVLFIVGAALSALLGTFARLVVTWLITTGAFGLSTQEQQTPPPQQYYTPPANPQPPYQQGYQGPPVQPPETYTEGERRYPYPAQQPPQQYDAPQSQYPQQMPPQ